MTTGTMREGPAPDKHAVLADAVVRYGRFWTELRPGSTRELLALACPDLEFRDPFNVVVGAERVVALLDHMFAHASDIRFDVLRHAWADETAFYRWDFACRLRRPATTLRIAGVSEVRFDAGGRVASHVDHWDAAAQVYERIPLLGTVLRLVRRRLAFAGDSSCPGKPGGATTQ
jgi:steroid delta-isomerase